MALQLRHLLGVLARKLGLGLLYSVSFRQACANYEGDR